jgi:hypothetical protein
LRRSGIDRPLIQAAEQAIGGTRLLLSAGAIAVFAPWPAAGPTLAFLQLVLGPANAAFSGRVLLGILDPANELVAGQRRDVLPSIECSGIGDQRLAQVSWKLVHHPTGHSRAAHRAKIAARASPLTIEAAPRIALLGPPVPLTRRVAGNRSRTCSIEASNISRFHEFDRLAFEEEADASPPLA